MMKKLAGFLVAAFTLCAPSAYAAECRSETARDMDIHELLKPLPADQAVNIVILIDPKSPLFQQFKQAAPIQYGAILNGIAQGHMNFDPDSAHRLDGIKDETFDIMPMVSAQGCLPEGTRLMDDLQALRRIPGILSAAPDVKLYEIPEIPSP
jgi:hypothetical protein